MHKDIKIVFKLANKVMPILKKQIIMRFMLVNLVM